MKSVAIIPAILREDFDEILQDVQAVSGLFNEVQIDIVDGVFTPYKSWPFHSQQELHTIRPFLDLLPFSFELDLIVAKPEETIPAWVSTGATGIVVHRDSTEQLEHCLKQIQQSQKKAVVAILPGSDVDSLVPLAEYIDGVQCMGIASVGAQGAPFDERVLETIKEVKEKLPKKKISVDGGVSDKNAQELLKKGARRLVVGSALFTGDVQKNAEVLKGIAEEF